MAGSHGRSYERELGGVQTQLRTINQNIRDHRNEFRQFMEESRKYMNATNGRLTKVEDLQAGDRKDINDHMASHRQSTVLQLAGVGALTAFVNMLFTVWRNLKGG